MSNVVLVYRVATDSGFSPCVDNDLFTLSCCKGGRKDGTQTGIRYWVGQKNKGYDWEKDDVYVVGTYCDCLLFYANITDVMEMTEYYSSNVERKDGIYCCQKGLDGESILQRNNRYKSVHPKEDTDQYIRDISGKYVLLSKKFLYLGRNKISLDALPFNKNFPKGQEAKTFKNEDADMIVDFLISLGTGVCGIPHTKMKGECIK